MATSNLHGYDGDTGAVVYAGGGPNELMAGTRSYSTTGIVARDASTSPVTTKCMLLPRQEERLRYADTYA